MNVVSEFLQNLKTSCGNVCCHSPYLQLYSLLESFVVKVERDKNVVFFFQCCQDDSILCQTGLCFLKLFLLLMQCVSKQNDEQKAYRETVKKCILFLSNSFECYNTCN